MDFNCLIKIMELVRITNVKIKAAASAGGTKFDISFERLFQILHANWFITLYYEAHILQTAL
jgi:isoprenylcysteine carboxyl methyltransferase (ICMT) family protein YpbQ